MFLEKISTEDVPVDRDKFNEEFDRIFGKKKTRKKTDDDRRSKRHDY